MKRVKKLLILLVVLLLFIAAAIWALQYEAKKEEVKNTGEVILNINPEEVTSLSWDFEGTTYSFHKEDHWVYDEDSTFPVDDNTILEMLSYFVDLKAAFTITDVKDFEQYGLTEPVSTIQITAGSQTYKISLGTFSTMDSKRYITLGSGKVFMTEEDPYEIFGVTLAKVLKTESIPKLLNAYSVAFSGDHTFTILADSSAEDVFYSEYQDQKMILDSFDVNNYLTLSSSLQFGDFATYKANEEDLAIYGMDAPDLSITYLYTADDAEQTFTLHISENPAAVKESTEDTEDSKDAEDKTEDSTEEAEDVAAAYARIGDSPIIYEITGSYYKNLMNSDFDHFRHTEVLTAEWDTVNQLDIVLDDVSYEFALKATDEGSSWYYKDEALDAIVLKAGIEKLEASSFTTETPALQEEIRFTAHYEGGSTEVAMYRYDGDYCLAVINGTPTSLVDRSEVVELVEAILDIVL